MLLAVFELTIFSYRKTISQNFYFSIFEIFWYVL